MRLLQQTLRRLTLGCQRIVIFGIDAGVDHSLVVADAGATIVDASVKHTTFQQCFMGGATDADAGVRCIDTVVVTFAMTNRTGNCAESAFEHGHYGSIRRVGLAVETVFVESKFGIGLERHQRTVGHSDLCGSVSANHNGILRKDIGFARQIPDSTTDITCSYRAGGSQHFAYGLNFGTHGKAGAK